METISLDGSTEMEEGEIVSDDLLEDISDDSISVSPFPKAGKFNSYKESLRALSLSSIEDFEELELSPIRPERRATRRKRKLSRHHHRHRSRSSSSSDSEINLSLTKRLLKEAIRIDSDRSHNNSLRTRLKGMFHKSPTREICDTDNKTTCNDLKDNLSDSEILPNDSPIQNEVVDKEQIDEPAEQDDELIQLRLEALKTAVMNKFEHRKKKNEVEKTHKLETNKENSPDNLNNANSPSIEACPEENSDNTQNNSDEDEDILRAVLLASISKKITKKDPPAPIKITTKNSTVPVQNVENPEKPLEIPKIPRFIISVNNPDSDSDDALKEEIKKADQKPPDIPTEVENEVEKFLKQQRAEVEAIQKLPLKEQTTIVKPNKMVNKVKMSEAKDIYKLLPKNKQIEYEKLIQRLRSAEKKPRQRKLSNRISEHKSALKNSRIRTLSRTAEDNVATEKNNGSFLQETIRQMQLHGRLQIKGKYHVLTPLMKKLSEASQEQKKHQLNINRLLSQLKEARNQCQKSQQMFNIVMKEFFKKKEEIDKSTSKNNIPQRPVSSTSQGLDCNKKIVTKTFSSISLPQKITSPQKPKEILQPKVVVGKCPANLTDPNDIEFKKIEPEEAITVPKYTSPLDNIGRLNDKINPLEIFCPFEINGSCRDKECNFNHCSKDL